MALNIKGQSLFKILEYQGIVTCIKYRDVGPSDEVVPHPVAVDDLPAYVDESDGMQAGKI